MRKVVERCMAGLLMGAFALVFVGAASSAAPPQSAVSPQGEKALKIGVANFKICIERSKIGQQEQARFEEMKRDMESTLEAKDKELSDLAAKFNDEYLDSLTAEAEEKLKQRFKSLSQELQQQQQQYYQLLQQANFQIMSELSEAVSSAATKIASEQLFDLILNDEVVYYRAQRLDVTEALITAMDAAFDKTQQKESALSPAAQEK